MRRRDFITIIAGAAAWPLAARAQGERTRRLGLLTALDQNDPEVRAWIRALQEGLERFGWEQGRNIHFEVRSASDPDVLRSSAAELVRMAPDVLFAGATPALVVLRQETRSLPIVFVQVSDPVKLGLVASLARPGGNITGFTNYEYPIAGKWLELLKDTAPGRKRVAVLVDPSNPSQEAYFQGIEVAAPSFGIQLIRLDLRDATDIERGINSFAQQADGALVIAPNNVTIPNRELIIALAAQHRLPAVYPYGFFARSGGFISYGVDLADQYRQAASYVDRILKGAKPGELPVQLSTKFELVVNLKAAKALGLTIPEPFLQAADEVIE
jgi:putative ABC transport system substrate-binding protein